jgi:hypothetical protein
LPSGAPPRDLKQPDGPPQDDDTDGRSVRADG